MAMERRNFLAFVPSVLSLLPFSAYSGKLLDKQDAELTLIIPYPPGGGIDTMARLIGRVLYAVSQRKVVVINASGGNQVVAANRLLNASNSDLTVMFSTTTLVGFIPAIEPNLLNFSPEKELIPIATVGIQRYILAAGSDVNIASLLKPNSTDYPKAGGLRIGSIGSAGALHFHSQALATVLHKALDVIPYRGMADVAHAMLSGQIQLAILDELSAQRLYPTSKIQLVATMSSEPSILFPTVPLWREFGLPVLDMDLLFVVYAGARMSMEHREELAHQMRLLGAAPAFHEGMLKIGVKPMVLVGNDARRYFWDSVEKDRRYIERFGKVHS